MRPIAAIELLDIIDSISFDNEELFRFRQGFVAKAGLEEATIEASAGFLAVTPVAFFGDRFDIDVEGADVEPAFVAGALDRSEHIIDLVAWPIRSPASMATLAGHATLLGMHNLGAYRLPGEPLPIFRTAARWLKNGGIGIVPIGSRAARAMLDMDTPLLAEDDAHGAELAAARQAILRKAPQILVAEPVRRAA